MPRLRIRDAGGTLRTIVRIRMRDENNVLRTITRIRARSTSNVLQTVFQPFSATISPSPATAYGSSGATANMTTGSVIATPSGGTSPFTHAWSMVGTSAYTWTADTPTASSTTFTATSVPAGAVASAIFQDTITDANGAIAIAQVGVTANNGQPYPPDDPNGAPRLIL